MRRKLSAFLVALTCISLLSSVLPVRAASISGLDPARGPVGQVVRLTGGLSCNGEYKIYWGNLKEENLIAEGQAIACKYLTTTFRVPETYKGRHRVILVDLQTQEEASHDFMVIPQMKASAQKGQVGTKVTVNGTGFAANESNIQLRYNGTPVAESLSSNIKGSWEATINIPESPKGVHQLEASGSLTDADEVKPVSFEVTPKIVLEPNFGGIGTEVAVSGTGFGSSETGITITFNGTPVRTGIMANSLGSFRTTFSVPSTTEKENVVNVFVKNDKVAEASNIIFTVGKAITLNPSVGYVGQEVTVLGSGFAPNESNIKIIYDDAEVSEGITADKNGLWKSTFIVPASPAGSHPVTAFGGTTSTRDVTAQYFVVMPSLTISPTSGGVGTVIVVSGKGFDMTRPVTITYDGVKLNLEVYTDVKGSFSCEFKVPPNAGEQHEVKATTGAGKVATATFFTETTPPPVPSLVSPAPGKASGLIGKQVVVFRWSEVSDSSGVTYVLEISRNSDFSVLTLKKKGLTQNGYTLAKAEALDQGTYYWRVKAVDGAGNESDWTVAQPFAISGLRFSTLLIIVGALVLVIILLVIWRFKPMMGGRV